MEGVVVYRSPDHDAEESRSFLYLARLIRSPFSRGWMSFPGVDEAAFQTAYSIANAELCTNIGKLSTRDGGELPPPPRFFRRCTRIAGGFVKVGSVGYTLVRKTYLSCMAIPI
jgi:hypothetical protein